MGIPGTFDLAIKCLEGNYTYYEKLAFQKLQWHPMTPQLRGPSDFVTEEKMKRKAWVKEKEK